MLNFTFYSPTYFVFGKDTHRECGKYVKRFGGNRVLLLYGGGSIKKTGLYDAICASLDHGTITYAPLGDVKPNPRSGLVYQGIELCRKEKVDFILAVGGGSVIDTAKAIAAGVKYDGDFWDFYEGKQVITTALPVGTVLTIPAAGSEGSPNSVITKEEGMLKRGTGSDALRPVFSILNPELTFTLPKYQIACGATDIIAHVLERYFTPTTDVEITDRLCEAVLLTMIKEVPRAIANPSDYEAQANIMWTGTVAHNNILGVGRIQDWSSHAIEHELSALYDCAHGAGLAVIFPAWMTYVMNKDVNRFAQLANRVFGVQMDFQDPEGTAREGIERFKAFLSSIGMPVTFAELGAKEQDIPLMANKITYGSKGIGGFTKLTASDVVNIYKLAL
jgi:alcohol dehydrogenase YqhD (iron-dependent ADH family)